MITLRLKNVIYFSSLNKIGAVDGFPANSGFAGNPANLDVTYNVPSPTV